MTTEFKFLKKIFSVIGTAILINILFNLSISDYFIYKKIRPKRYQQKLQYIEKNIDQFDTIFIGSSRTENGFKSKLFAKLSGYTTFNWGLHGQFSTRMINNLKIYSQIIKKSKTIKRVFIEISPLSRLEYDSNFIDRSNPINEISHLIDIKEKIKLADIEVFIKMIFTKYTRNIFYIFKENHFNMNHFRDSGILNIKKIRDKNLIKRRDDFLKDYKIYKPKPVKYLQETQVKDYIWLENLYEFCKSMQEQNIEIIFYLEPALNYNKTLEIIYPYIKKNNINLLDLNSVETNLQLYDEDLFFDKSHLNSQGAEVFTHQLYKKYMESKNAI
jgi:hypothetical protein